MNVTARGRNGVHEFDGGPNERLLHAGLRQGIALPYECGTGTCGTCKAKLISGKVRDSWPSAPGAKSLRHDAGEFLLCQCVPMTECVIEVGRAIEKMEMGSFRPAYFRGTVKRASLLARDVVLLRIDIDRPLDFEAGQFMAVKAPDIAGFRAYSMVNFMRQTTSIGFVVKRKPSGRISERVFTQPSEGLELSLFGPLGKATFDPGAERNVVCIAGGTGIASMMSMLERALQERYFDRFRGHLFFGVRSAQDAFFLDELSRFRGAFKGALKIAVSFSDGDVPQSYRTSYPELQFEKGLVHEVASRCVNDWRHSVRAYVAGPPPAVAAALKTLIVEAQLAPGEIRYDKFT